MLSARVLRLVSRLHPLTPNRSAPITKDEEELKAKIDKLVADYTGKRANTIHTSELVGLGSAGSHADAATALNGRLSARLNELWVAVAQRKAKRAFAGSKEEWAVVDEAEVGKVLEVRSVVELLTVVLTMALRFLHSNSGRSITWQIRCSETLRPLT